MSTKPISFNHAIGLQESDSMSTRVIATMLRGVCVGTIGAALAVVIAAFLALASAGRDLEWRPWRFSHPILEAVHEPTELVDRSSAPRLPRATKSLTPNRSSRAQRTPQHTVGDNRS